MAPGSVYDAAAAATIPGLDLDPERAETLYETIASRGYRVIGALEMAQMFESIDPARAERYREIVRRRGRSENDGL